MISKNSAYGFKESYQQVRFGSADLFFGIKTGECQQTDIVKRYTGGFKERLKAFVFSARIGKKIFDKGKIIIDGIYYRLLI